MKRITIIAVAAWLACSSIAVAGDYLDKNKKQREYAEPNEDAAIIYVVRNSSVGLAIKFWAFADDDFLGVSRGKSYFFAEVPPGRHTFWSKAENVSALDLEVKAGRTYFLKQGVRIGLGKARVKLVQIDEAEGRKLINKLPFASPTDEGRARGAEIAAKRYERVAEKQARRGK